MNSLKNQKGAALVIVLFLIVTISIFSMTLFSSSFNSTLQHKKVEETTQLNELVTMGMMNLRKEIFTLINNGEVDLEDYDEMVNTIKAIPPVEIEFSTTKNIKYTVLVNNINIVVADYDNDGTKDDYLITYKSKATIDSISTSKEKEGKVEVIIDKEIKGNISSLTWSLVGR